MNGQRHDRVITGIALSPEFIHARAPETGCRDC
jgi:hypothetical protein